jgi:hypothetical protein
MNWVYLCCCSGSSNHELLRHFPLCDTAAIFAPKVIALRHCPTVATSARQSLRLIMLESSVMSCEQLWWRKRTCSGPSHNYHLPPSWSSSVSSSFFIRIFVIFISLKRTVKIYVPHFGSPGFKFRFRQQLPCLQLFVVFLRKYQDSA